MRQLKHTTYFTCCSLWLQQVLLVAATLSGTAFVASLRIPTTPQQASRNHPKQRASLNHPNSVSPRQQDVSLASFGNYLDQLSTPTTEPNHQPSMALDTVNLQGSDQFETIPILSLDQADTIANSVIHVCKRNSFQPVSIHVLDQAGNTIVSKRMDGCSPVGIPDFSKAKAYSCIVNKYSSRTFRDRYTAEPNAAKFCQMTTMVAIAGNSMAPFPGGVLLQANNKGRQHIVGAVGVSGAAGDEDEYCAIVGVKESALNGLSTIPEQHSCSTVKD